MMNRRKMLPIAKMLVMSICFFYMVIGVTKTYANEDVIREQDSKEVVQTKIVAVTEEEKKEETSSVKLLKYCDEYERYLLAKIAMAEAEGEDIKGKALVILVVMNRVESDSFPDTVEEVIFQKNQFSPLKDGRWNSVEPNEDCWEALEMILHDNWDESNGATYFESGGQSNWHRNKLRYLFNYGNHYFYIERR